VADNEISGQLPDQAEERFAANLRGARERAGLSQEAVASQMRDAGFDVFRQQTVAAIESGSRSVRLGEALALGRIVGSDMSALVRPQGMLREAWRLLDSARAVTEASELIADGARKLAHSRERLDSAMTQVEQAGLEQALADEMFAARRAGAVETMSVLRAVAGELLTPSRWRLGRTLDSSERQQVLQVAEALRAVAEDEPERVTSRQEEAFRLADSRAAEARAKLADAVGDPQATPLAQVAAQAKQRRDAGASFEEIGQWLAEVLPPGMMQPLVERTYVTAESLRAVGQLPAAWGAHQEPAGRKRRRG
jgi:transcriptional regulator with XRE-family HTH domain